MTALPAPRGPLSATVLRMFRCGPPPAARPPGPPGHPDPWGEDLQLALYLCYELHYRGFDKVAAEWEWDPELLGLRRDLEQIFLADLRAETAPVPPLDELLASLLTEPREGTGPSYHLRDHGERWQAREYLIHRSLYHLKEGDPQLWVVPRLTGEARAAFLAIEYNEYGAGRAERAHARLFGEMMADFGLDPTYGRYLNLAAAPALAVVNLMSMFGLHRSLRGALVGQFALAEVTSSPASARLVEAFERLGAGPAGTRFHAEHVEADAVHEQLVRTRVIDALPELAQDIAFGIAASALTEQRLADHLLNCWQSGRSSLRPRAVSAVAGVAERVATATAAGADGDHRPVGSDR